MPVFHFHLRNSDGLHLDVFGLECPDLQMAYLEACCAIPGVSAKLIGSEENPMAYAFEIADADGIALLEVPFRATLRDTRKLTKTGLPATRLRVRTGGTHTLATSV